MEIDELLYEWKDQTILSASERMEIRLAASSSDLTESSRWWKSVISMAGKALVDANRINRACLFSV